MTAGRRWVTGLILLAVAAIGFTLFTRHNDFPYHYHQAEMIKARQVINWQKINFKHPLLMINATRIAQAITGTPDKKQPVTELGRDVNAGIGTLGVLAFMGAALLFTGPIGAVATGLLIETQAVIVENFHYFKEEPAHFLGIGLILLAGNWFQKNPTARRLMLLAAAVGVALASKYPAWWFCVLTGLYAFYQVYKNPAGLKTLIKGRTINGYLLFTAVTLLTFLALNWEMVVRLEKFAEGFSAEFMHAAGGDTVTKDAPHRWVLYYYTALLPLPVQMFFFVYLAGFIAQFRERTDFEKLELLYFFSYALILSFSPEGTDDKRAIPILVTATYLSVKGLAEILKWLLNRDWSAVFPATPGKRAVYIGAFLIFTVAGVFSQWPATAVKLSRFHPAADTRLVLVGWIKNNLPADAVIVQDKITQLSSAEGNTDPRAMRIAQAVTVIPQTVIWGGHGMAADVGTLDELRAMGVTHVVIVPVRYKRLLRGSRKATPGYEAMINQRRQFYLDLIEHGNLLWQVDRPGNHTELQEGLSLYRI